MTSILERRVASVAVALAVTIAACGSTDSSGSNGAPAAADPALGLVAHGFGSATVAADIAYVVNNPLESVLGLGGGLGGDSDVADKRAPLRAALAKLDLPPNAVQLGSASDDFEPAFPIQIEVPVWQLPEIAHQVRDVIRKVLGETEHLGLRLAVADCPRAYTDARNDAIEDARTDAEQLARTADVPLGPLRRLSEGGDSALAALYGPLAGALGTEEPCGRSTVGELSIDSLYQPLPPLDAEPEVTLHYAVTAVYDIGRGADRTVTASGTATADGPADAAEIIVATTTFGVDAFDGLLGGSDEQGLAPGDEEAIAKSLAPFGVERDAVHLEPERRPLLVRVHLDDPQRAAEVGPKVIAALRERVGPDADSGIVFTAENCPDLVARAREQAFREADSAAETLASVAQARTGALVGLTENRADIFSPFAMPSDPCAPDFAVLVENGLGVDGSGLFGAPSLVPPDEEPSVHHEVSISVTRGITPQT